MKKLFAVLAIAAFMTACNSGSSSTESTSDTTTTVTTVDTTTAPAAVDTAHDPAPIVGPTTSRSAILASALDVATRSEAAR